MINKLTLFEKIFLYMVSLFVLTAVFIEVKYSYHLISEWFSSLAVIEYCLMFFAFVCMGVIINELRRYYKMIQIAEKSIYAFTPSSELEFERQLQRQHNLERTYLMTRLSLEKCYEMTEKEFQFFIRDILRELNFSDFKINRKRTSIGSYILAYTPDGEPVFIGIIHGPREKVISVEQIRELYGEMFSHQMAHGLMITTCFFDELIIENLNDYQIELIDATKLALWFCEIADKLNASEELGLEHIN